MRCSAGAGNSFRISARAAVLKIGRDFFEAQRFEAKLFRDWVVVVRESSVGWIGSKTHGDVDVFENLTGSNAENSIAGFDEVVPFSSAMLAAKVIGEAEAGVELLGFYQKASAVSLPLI